MINLDFRYCVGTERTADGFIRYAPDAYGGAAGSSPMLESICPFGLLSRPPDPDVDADGNPLPAGAASLLVLEHGGTDYAMPLQHPRVADTLPAIQKGEAIVYGFAGQFMRFHADSAISIYTTHDGTPDGRTLSIMLTPEDGYTLNTPWGTMKMGPNGFHVLHSSGARIDMGAIGGFTAPLDTLGSYVKIQADMVSILGSAVSIGTDAGVANATATAALQTLLTALVAAVSSALPSSGITAAQIAAVQAANAVYQPLAGNIGKVV